MKNAIYFVLPVLAIIFVTFAILKWGLVPRPATVMDPSFFDAPEELGVVLYRRFFVEVEQNPVVLWGVAAETPEHIQVVSGFLRAAEAAGTAMNQVILDEEFTWGGPPLLVDAQVMNFQNQFPELRERIMSAVEKGERTLLITKFGFTSQRLAVDTLSKTLRRELDQGVLSVTHLPFAFNSAEEAALVPSCEVMADNGLAELGCLSLQKSRAIYRKVAKFPHGKWVAMLDQWPGNDLILYFRFYR